MKWTWLMIPGFLAIMAVGLYLALKTGEKSPIYASGSIELAPTLANDAKGINTLYMVIYDLDSPMPMPYGALKINLDQSAHEGRFVDFSITKEKLQLMPQAMATAQSNLPRRMRIKARLDADGLGGMDQQGDITGEVHDIAFGRKDVLITLDRKI